MGREDFKRRRETRDALQAPRKRADAKPIMVSGFGDVAFQFNEYRKIPETNLKWDV